MQDFKRAFGITLSVIILLFALVFAFELTNRIIAESGFSSGEVFDFEFEENVFSGEVFGRKFSADFSPFFGFLPKMRFLLFFLPPFIRFGIIVLGTVL